MAITIFKIYTEFSELYWFLSLLRILLSALVFSFSIAVINSNKLETGFYVRWFIQIDIIINILIKTKSSFGYNQSANLISSIFTNGANNSSILNGYNNSLSTIGMNQTFVNSNFSNTYSSANNFSDLIGLNFNIPEIKFDNLIKICN